MKIFSRKLLIFFLFLLKYIDYGYSLEPSRLAQNIDCGYTLEPPRRGGSNKYPQSMFWSKIQKTRYTSAYPSFAIYKVGLKLVYFSWTSFPNEVAIRH